MRVDFFKALVTLSSSVIAELGVVEAVEVGRLVTTTVVELDDEEDELVSFPVENWKNNK